MKCLTLLLSMIFVSQCALAKTESQSDERVYSFAKNHALILSIDEHNRPVISNYAGNENRQLEWYQKRELTLSYALQQLKKQGIKRDSHSIVTLESVEQDLALLLESLLKHYNSISFHISHIEESDDDRYSLCFPQSGIPHVGMQMCSGFESDVESAQIAPLLIKLMQNLPANIASGVAPSVNNRFRYNPELNSDDDSPTTEQEVRQHLEWIEEQLSGICGRETPGLMFTPDGGGEFCSRKGARKRELHETGQWRVWGYYIHRDGSFDKAFHEAYFPLTRD